MEQKPLTVTQISNYFKQIFDAEELLFNVRVVGEISGLSIVRGVAYFVLKDENAMMSCVCFDVSNFTYQNGDKVVLTGTPRYYVEGGKLNFNVQKAEKYGLGDLYQQFLKLKETLEKSGYFDESHKIPMPKTIKRIGVVTSKEGAVIQDIINVRSRRNPYIDIVLYPVKVQGKDAEKEIAKGIRFFDNYNVDVIVVARGGGSLEDLAPFNTKAIKSVYIDKHTYFVGLYKALLDDYSDENSEMSNNLVKLIMRLKYSASNFSNLQFNNFKLLESKLNKLNPSEVLKLGFAVVRGKGGEIRSVKDIDIGDDISIKLVDGDLFAKVTNKENRNDI